MEKKKFPQQISTERLELRQHSEDQAPTMFSYIDLDRDRLRQFLPWVDFTKAVDDSLSYIKMTLEKWDKFELFDYGIYRKSDGLYLGNVGVHTISWPHQRCELGYWILGLFEGQGYMSEAVLGLHQAAFEIGFNRVEIRCSSLNLKSASIPKRLGYLLDGTLRQDAIELDKFRDTLVFSKLKLDSLE